MSLLIDPARNAARNRDDKRVRSTQEAKPKDTYYRKEYGWIMSNADVKAEQGVKAEHDANVTNVKGQVAKADGEYQTSLAKGRTDINAAYDTAIADMAGKANPTLVEKKYVDGRELRRRSEAIDPDSHVGPAYAQETPYINVSMSQQGIDAFEKAIKPWEANKPLPGSLPWKKKSNPVPTANGDYDAIIANLYQQEYDKAMIANAKQVPILTANYNKERTAKLDGFNKSSASNYAGAKALWDAEINQASTAYGNRVATGKASYEDSKAKYNDSVRGVNMGLLESPTNQVKTGI